MRTTTSAAAGVALLGLLGTVGTAVAAGEKAKYAYKAQAGQVARYRTEGTLAVEAMGQKVTLDVKEVEKVTFAQVAMNGDLTMERETESTELSINGNKLPAPDDHSKSSTTIKSDGSLVAMKSDSADKDETKTSARLYAATNPVFPDRELGVGDKWSYTAKLDADLGTHKGQADYELLTLEKVGGVDTAKIKMAYKETDDTPPLGTTGTVWVEVSSGDTVQADFELSNMPFGSGEDKALGNGKIHQERIAGGPMGGPKGADGKPELPKVKTIDDIVKDYEKTAGLFTLYKKHEAGRDTFYLELREDQLEKLFLLQATASTGTGSAVIAGDPINDILFKFSQVGDERVLMVTPNILFKAAEGSPIARSVKRGFADGYLESFKIEAKQPSRKSLLINISDLFLKDIAQISQVLSGGGLMGMMGGGGYSLDREKSFVAQFKVLPENVFVETAYHFSRGGGRSFFDTELADPRSLPLRVNFNLWQLTDTGYRPRYADARVGYFYTETQDFSDDGKDDQMVRYALRWDLRKADPDARVSAPVKPITFWLDNAIPTEYRAAVRDGILMWNRAFEKIGFKDAIVVKQMPDNADFDHADMRYNVIRWSTTQVPPYGAVSLFRVNPLTGEIVNAGITVDASLTRWAKLERRDLVDPAVHFDPQAAPVPKSRKNLFRCEFAAGARREAWFGHTALSLLQGAGVAVDEKAYTADFLRSIVAHEFGHTLGLFHNFAASTQFSLSELRDPKRLKERGVTGSVMDYFPFNIAAIKQKGVDYWTTTVGPYDFWAVEYGYTPMGSGGPDAELPRLKAIASRGNEPGHAYLNDFVADQFDPAVARFDLSAEPLEYNARKLELTRYLMLHLTPRLPKQGQSYWEFTRTFLGLLSDYTQAAAQASRYVGGLHVSHNYRGDAKEKPTLQPVTAVKQRRALQLLNDFVFSETALKFPPAYFSHMTDEPFPSLTSAIMGNFTSPEFPIRDQLSAIQRSALRRLFSGAVLNRIANTEFKAGAADTTLTMPYLFNSVTDAVWSELATRKNVAPLRRQLQRTELDLLIPLAVNPGGGPDDAKSLAWDKLRQLKARIAAVPRAGVDQYTRVHLDESAMRIQRALSAVQTVSDGRAPAAFSLQQLLGGAEAEKREP